MNYAVVDIETTGGSSKFNRVIEVAAFIFNGEKIIDEFQSLVNPGQHVPSFITGLTGIDENMIMDAPSFEEIASELHEKLKDCVFVAHNVNFDLGFLREEFSRVNITYNPLKLCTVRLSRKLIPGLPSYSLGKLSTSLGIQLNDRHRAFGDAEATVEVLRQNLIRDQNGFIQKSLKRSFKEAVLPPNLDKELFEALPSSAGVYYFINAQNEVLYVGKANNIRKRIMEHFSDGSKIKSIRLLWENIHNISYELCGNELISLLFEANEIKRLWPPYNSALKRASSSFGIFKYEDQNGYFRLSVQKLGKSHLKPLLTFNSNAEARVYLTDATRNFQLCARLSGIQKTNGACFDHGLGQCKGACINEEKPEDYNLRLEEAFDKRFENLNLMIVGKGRNEEEQSVVAIENGSYKGFGFIDGSVSVDSIDEVLDQVKIYKSYPEIESILTGFLSRNSSHYQLINFNQKVVQ
ncbi:MAG: exonuclease domain-containing protein [Bacteroidota bacterium]